MAAKTESTQAECSQDETVLDVIVTNLAGAEVCRCSLPSSAMLLDVMQKIAYDKGHAPHSQQLLYGTELLASDLKLADLTEGATELQLTLCKSERKSLALRSCGASANYPAFLPLLRHDDVFPSLTWLESKQPIPATIQSGVDLAHRMAEQSRSEWPDD
eukprot:4886642-Amphidinium_carterae.3